MKELDKALCDLSGTSVVKAVSMRPNTVNIAIVQSFACLKLLLYLYGLQGGYGFAK